jgi:hypothetical protein
LTTQSIARIFLVLALVWKILEINLSSKKLVTDKASEKVIILVLALFATQSLSVFSAMNIDSFLVRYKDVMLGVIAFFAFYLYKNEYKKIIFVLILSVPVNIIYQALLFFRNSAAIDLLGIIIYQKHFGYVLANLDRGRIFTDTYDEITIPFLLENKSKNKSKFVNYLLLALIIFFSAASNFRSKLLMLAISIGGSLLVFEKSILNKKLLLITLIIVTVGFAASIFTSEITGISFVDRITFQSEETDVNTLTSRGRQIEKGTELGFTSLFGVGLGNYYDNINKNILTNNRDLVSEGGSEYIHNIFGSTIAETGYISFILLIFTLILFARADYNMLKNGAPYQKAFIISFWTLFSYALFNPTIAGSPQVLFWGIRGVLLK